MIIFSLRTILDKSNLWIYLFHYDGFKLCTVSDCPFGYDGVKLSSFVLVVSNCPFCYYGVKLSYLSSWCQIVLFVIMVSNCPTCPHGVKLSFSPSWRQIVLGVKLSYHPFCSITFESVMKYLLPIRRALTVVYYPMYCRFFIASKTDSRQFIKII